MMGGVQGSISSTEIHDILRNERRRRAIECLLEDGSVTVRDLSEKIAEMETGESPPPCDARKSVYVTLHQNHLSKLEEADIIRYDSNEVKAGDRIEELREYVTDGREVARWAEACASVSLLGILAVGIATLGLPVVAGLVSLLSVFFLAVIFLVCLYVVSKNRAVPQHRV